MGLAKESIDSAFDESAQERPNGPASKRLRSASLDSDSECVAPMRIPAPMSPTVVTLGAVDDSVEERVAAEEKVKDLKIDDDDPEAINDSEMLMPKALRRSEAPENPHHHDRNPGGPG